MAREEVTYYGEADDDSRAPLDKVFNLTYDMKGKKYIATIKAVWADGQEQRGKYKVIFGNGSHTIIDYMIGGTGWIEEGKGPTLRAAEIGKHIQAHFSSGQQSY